MEKATGSHENWSLVIAAIALFIGVLSAIGTLVIVFEKLH